MLITMLCRNRFATTSYKQPALLQGIILAALASFCLLFRSEDTLLNWLLLVIPLAITTVLLLSHAQMTLPALFFTLVYIFRISFDLQLGLWLAIPLAFYIALTLLIRPWREHAQWLRWGEPNRWSWMLAIITVLVSSIALIIWMQLAQPDLSLYSSMLPHDKLWLIVLAGLGFATANALVEEFIFRGILWDALERLFTPIWLILTVQAVIFGAMHLHGVPRGISGMALAAIYGALLGIVRWQSRGLGAPVITHFFADLTIFLIIFLPIL
jgi:membrane protease YdiL (CAAX protease family)